MGINPNDYIPEYQGEQPNSEVVVPPTLEPEKPGLIKRLYARLFNDGVNKVPRLKAKFYQSSQSGETSAIGSSHQKQSLMQISKQHLKTSPKSQRWI